jgi:hypothetical protein
LKRLRNRTFAVDGNAELYQFLALIVSGHRLPLLLFSAASWLSSKCLADPTSR